MVYFRNDDQEYISWLERHPMGFVLNLATGGKHKAMLHTARCGHLYPVDVALSNTVTYPKACAGDRDELDRWGQEFGFAMAPCPDCRPR